MRALICGFLLCAMVLSANAQEKYFTKTGHIYFLSHTDVIDIDGNNKQVASFLNTKTGDIVFAVLVKSFEFTLATAAEHFNETYMESHKFPKASFTGKIKDFNKIDLTKKATYKVIVEGKLTIHGVTKEVIENATLQTIDKSIKGRCNFKVSIGDYNIKVPKVVEDRVAKVVDIKVDMDYLPYNGK
jgi:polyisoprenoid-binding protein YceI